MKAIVLEIKNGEAAVLREDGVVERVRRSCEVGDTIELSEVVSLGSRRKGAGRSGFAWRSMRIAASVVLVLGLMSYGGWTYNTALAASYVTVDIDEASVEYTLNRRGDVIGVKALNTAGESIAEGLTKDAPKRRSLDESLDEMVNIVYEQGLLEEDGDEGYMVVSVSANSEEREARIAETFERSFSEGRGRNMRLSIGRPEDREARRAELKETLRSEEESKNNGTAELPEAAENSEGEVSDERSADKAAESGPQRDNGGDRAGIREEQKGAQGAAPEERREPAPSEVTEAPAMREAEAPFGGEEEAPNGGEADRSENGNTPKGEASEGDMPGGEPADRDMQGGKPADGAAPGGGRADEALPSEGQRIENPPAGSENAGPSDRADGGEDIGKSGGADAPMAPGNEGEARPDAPENGSEARPGQNANMGGGATQGAPRISGSGGQRERRNEEGGMKEDVFKGFGK